MQLDYEKEPKGFFVKSNKLHFVKSDESAIPTVSLSSVSNILLTGMTIDFLLPDISSISC